MPHSYISKNKKSEIFNYNRALTFKQPKFSSPPLNLRSDPFSQAIILLYIQGSLSVSARPMNSKSVNFKSINPKYFDSNSNNLTISNSIQKPCLGAQPDQCSLVQRSLNELDYLQKGTSLASQSLAHFNKAVLVHADNTVSSVSRSLRGLVTESASDSAIISGVGAMPSPAMMTIHRSIIGFFIKNPPTKTINNNFPHVQQEENVEPVKVVTEDFLIEPSVIDLTREVSITDNIIKYFNETKGCERYDSVANQVIEYAAEIYTKILAAIDHPTLQIDSWLEKKIADIVKAEGGNLLIINGELAINTFLSPKPMDIALNIIRPVNDYTLRQIITKEYRRGQYANTHLEFKWPEFITPAMAEVFINADIESEYISELDNHLSSDSVSDNLKQYFTIMWKAKINNYIRNNNFFYNADEINNINEYMRIQVNPRVVYWDNLPVGNLFMIPFSERVIPTPYNMQIETRGILFSTTDPRVFKFTSNGNVVMGANQDQLNAFIKKHLPYTKQEIFENLIKITEEVGKNFKFSKDTFGMVTNTPRLTFSHCDDLGTLHYRLFIENLRSDMDYISKSDEEIRWDSVLETIDMIGTAISIAAIPLTLGASSHFAVARLTHATTSLIFTSITTVIPKLIQAQLADRPIDARKHVTDAILALTSEGIGSIIGQAVKTLPNLKSISSLVPEPIKLKIERLVQKKLANKLKDVNQLNIGAHVALPFIDHYASKKLPQQTTLLLENLASKRKAFEGMLVKKARKTARRKDERFYLISKQQLLNEWLPNTFYNVISNLWGKTALNKWINNNPNSMAIDFGKELSLADDSTNEKPLYFIGTDLRGVTINDNLVLTNFQHSEGLLQQGLIQSYNASEISSALYQAEECAHWSPKLEILRHEELRLIADYKHPYINNSALAAETNIPFLLDNSQRLINRFHTGIIGINPRTHDDIHIPLIVVTDKTTDFRLQGGGETNVHADVFSLENIRAIIAPEDVVEQVAALFQQQSRKNFPFYYFSTADNNQLSLSPAATNIASETLNQTSSNR